MVLSSQPTTVMLVFVCSLLYLGVSVTGATVCEQNELGQIVEIECNSPLAPYCCTYNGRVSCCTEDQYNRKVNGPSTNTLLGIAIGACVAIVALFYWCYIKYKKKKAIDKEERWEMERQIRRLSRIQQRLSVPRMQPELVFTGPPKQQKVPFTQTQEVLHM